MDFWKFTKKINVTNFHINFHIYFDKNQHNNYHNDSSFTLENSYQANVANFPALFSNTNPQFSQSMDPKKFLVIKNQTNKHLDQDISQMLLQKTLKILLCNEN